MEHAETISITISTEMLQAILESVAAGEFESTSGAVHEAIRLWRRQRSESAERLAIIRQRIRRSLDDPRADMTLHEVDAHLATLFSCAEAAGDNAAA